MIEKNQSSLELGENDNKVENVNEFKFEPIKGYPMLNWQGKRPFTSTQFYPAQLKEVYGEEVDGATQLEKQSQPSFRRFR